MQGKITLITPPDIFENENVSILFVHLSDQDQDTVSKWLSSSNIDQNLNFYVFGNESNVEWLMYAINRCDYTYIDIDHCNLVTQLLSGFLLTKSNIFYKTEQQDVASIYSHINSNRISSIEKFLEDLLIV